MGLRLFNNIKLTYWDSISFIGLHSFFIGEIKSYSEYSEATPTSVLRVIPGNARRIMWYWELNQVGCIQGKCILECALNVHYL